MVNKEIREALDIIAEGAVVFDNYAYDNSIIGVTTDNRVVYDYEMMINELSKEANIDETEAMEWIDYNTIRAIPYAGANAPVIIEYNREYLFELGGSGTYETVSVHRRPLGSFFKHIKDAWRKVFFKA